MAQLLILQGAVKPGCTILLHSLRLRYNHAPDDGRLSQNKDYLSQNSQLKLFPSIFDVSCWKPLLCLEIQVSRGHSFFSSSSTSLQFFPPAAISSDQGTGMISPAYGHVWQGSPLLREAVIFQHRAQVFPPQLVK